MEEKDLIKKLEEKFTKANMYNVLLAYSKNELDGVELSKIMEIVKPQKGGGATSNPSYTEDGINYHWCRLGQRFLPEDRINMSLGKPKGTGILESKIAYRIEKASKLLKEKAMARFIAQDYEGGANLNAEADEILKMIEDPSNFTDKAMASSIYHPDYGKESKETKEDSSEELI